MIFHPIVDAAADLMRRPGGADRADRPRRRTAELVVLLKQSDVCPGRSRFDRSGESGSAASDDDNVEDHSTAIRCSSQRGRRWQD